MVDDHLIYLVTIPIHDGSSEGSEKDVFGSEKSSEKIIKSSERSSKTTAISSGTGSGTDVTSSGTRQKTSEKIIELINADPQILPLDI